MEELDLLKKDWNKDNYPKITENEIYKLMLKSSSSTVKWIFIVSLIELGLGFVLSIGLSFTKFDSDNTQLLKDFGIYNYYLAFTAFLYVVIVYFIVNFYLMYRKVSTTDNTKLLMKNILKTRKTVQNYILFNLVAFAVFSIAILTYSFKMGVEKASNENLNSISDSFYLIAFLVIVLVTAAITGLFWVIYRLIYGFLLKKLKVNYQELKKIDL
ncbi:hypothetical protein [Flavobacterium sp.]|uniref:hypothetical protein n=1 Tax=Flavobacterium sp. TaxID=239 RepID=UPI00286E559E|nr:hypothetical protein [Flavobacterium sp.]